ncbi:MAG: insulinase family protein [Desulfobacteraceae bacterium]|nr:insulinase family protein [Desulfobacteraceae bacterium]
MPHPSDPNNPGLSIGTELHGYRIQRISVLKELDAIFYLLEHITAGARHLHISNKDQENTFGVTFKTIPADSTGVAHILEHTVLCGSRRYPVRDPFFSMLKRSLSTFMNAFTASDWTMYPFATQNRKDYYNLMDVYLDAAFFPVLDRLSFKQEGHRLELEPALQDKSQIALVYKGVVYNEMKGAMSSPDQIMGRSMLNALFPDTTYRNNSGGDPAVIPQLTYDQLVGFHQRHYHPSNAFFYTYGNLPLKDHLAFIADKVMGRFTRIDPRTEVPSQPRWNAPRTARYTYPLAAEEDPARKYQVAVAWLTCDLRDTFEVLVLSVLEQILIGNAASPLRKALMDSGLGSTLSDGSGYDADSRDTLFSCGLKDTTEAAAEQVEKIIFTTLEQLAANGLDPEMIASAIHQIEFHRKEVTNTPYPYGIKLMLMSIGSWLHGGDPQRVLQLDADFQRLHQEIAAGRFLEQRIRQYFLDNPHRVRMVLAPDQQKATQEEQRVRQELQAIQAKLDESARRQIQSDAMQLKQRQEHPEDVSCLPTLALADIPPEIDVCAPSLVEKQLPLWRYALSTSGIHYLSAALGTAAVPEELLPWVPFFCYTFSKSGTALSDYTQMARRMDAVTGGVGMNAQARISYDQTNTCLPLLQLNAKCLTRNIDPMYAIVEELIGQVDFKDLPRIKQLVGEYRSNLESGIVQNGHRLAISLSSRTFSPASALAEMWSGIHQVKLVRAFSERIDDQRIAELAHNLAAIAKKVFTPDNLVMAAIGEADAVEAAARRIAGSTVLSAFQRPALDLSFATFNVKTEAHLPREGWSTSSAVSFVAQTFPTVSFGHADAPVLAVLSKVLRSLYLHREIREKGGAYGGFALYNPESGLFSLASYRDPHIVQTLNVYAGVAEFMRTAPISDEDIKEAILQVCAEIDKPDPPGVSARKAFWRQLVKLNDQTRRQYKQQLLQVTRARVLAAAESYFRNAQDHAAVAVISGQEQLAAANGRLGAKPLELKAI